jgi:hypothetical protein
MKKDFKNKTVYIRESYNEEHPFTIISNHLVKDERLNATEKGIMLMIFSNANIYVLNSTYLQKESGIGKVQFNNCMKHLQELGYLVKKPLKNGGYKWIIIESTLIFEDLKKLGYLTYDFDKSSWLIDDELESTLQLFDFHGKSGNRKPINQKPIKEKPIIKNPDNQIPDSQPIININDTSNNIEIIKNEENRNKKCINETLDDEVLTFGSFSEVETEKIDLKSHIQNSLPILFEQGGSLRNIFQESSLTLNEFKDYSDSYIAHIALAIKLEKVDTRWSESFSKLNYNRKHYGIIVYACRNALDSVTQTNLKKELIGQSKMSEQELHKHFFGY